jgi:hypothetical protein
MTHHPGFPAGVEAPADTSNRRNGSSRKTLITTRPPLKLDYLGIHSHGLLR